MDIAALSMMMSTTQVKQQASLSVMDKAIGDAESKGNQMVEMLEKSIPHPDLGNKIDLRG
ncbi:YjfB family protein [Halobacillus yeomjeoni]|uniref:YjfB family protein n=1 Tax=Halobacillus yeomjeoni TaxID=311194 RepID=A0A931HVL8_9BACI|nr:YjfB family protein [Halobacillus yeomjeoni]MBH0230615.1 YjfB family protein [Halobacillus yeomjeoni]MCA0985501.1 YjfB family protein [Halobacillus yeomjeoni]